MQLVHHSNEPPRKDILNSLLRQLDNLSERMEVLESAAGGGTATIKARPLPCNYFPIITPSQPHERKPFKLEYVPDDVFFLVIDQFDSPSAPFDLHPIRDVKTLRAIRWYVNPDSSMHC